MPASIASILSLNLQNFSEASSSAMARATAGLSEPYCFSSSDILFSTA
jgi:hypothetical protein